VRPLGRVDVVGDLRTPEIGLDQDDPQPDWLRASARLQAVVDVPSWASALVMTIERGLWSTSMNCRFVRSWRKAYARVERGSVVLRRSC
jgi:hypothetical protein